MTNQHPITPPPELVQEWWESTIPNQSTNVKTQLCIQAVQWGADQELEACVEHLFRCGFSDADILRLRTTRRPKPPSLKEQALTVLDDCSDRLDSAHENTIRRALEALDD